LEPAKKPFSGKHAPFAQARIFSVAGLISLAVSAVFLSLLYRELAITAIVEFGEQNNIVLAQTALNAVKPELTGFLAQRSNVRANEVFDPTIPVGLQTAIRETMRDTSVVRLKIYNQHGVVVFSTRRSQIGLESSQNPGFVGAMRGRPESRLVYGSTFNLWDEEQEDDNLIQTYLPVRDDPWTPVLGVFEIYTDVSGLAAKTERLQLLVVAGVFLTFALLYGFLMYIVLRGDRVIRSQQDTILARTKTLELLSARMLTAEENERSRVAHKLHEGVAQTLAAVKLQVESVCATACDLPPQRRRTPVDSVVKAIQQAIQEVRTLAMEMHPPSLHDIGLLSTIDWACREFGSIYPNISVDTAYETTEQQIPPALKTIIFRIVQEILSHIGYQGNADAVHVKLQTSDSAIRLSIEDNGFAYHSPSPDVSSETGMASTRERAVLSGGSFAILSNHRGGTIYEAVWSTDDGLRGTGALMSSTPGGSPPGFDQDPAHQPQPESPANSATKTGKGKGATPIV
jgi:signal transduction histidine kinase